MKEFKIKKKTLKERMLAILFYIVDDKNVEICRCLIKI